VLNHLYVLLPVLDDEKHYFVGKAEIEKLLFRGGDWLNAHPQKEEIVKRYLRRQAPVRWTRRVVVPAKWLSWREND
jgi:hypothetical protein